MEQIKDGGPVMTCSKCGVAFIPRAWQVNSRDYRCMPCKRKVVTDRELLELAAKAMQSVLINLTDRGSVALDWPLEKESRP